MAIFLPIWFGLLSVGSAEESEKKQMLELAITSGPSDSDNFYQQIVEETRTQAIKSRQRISQIVQNDSEVAQSRKPRHAVYGESPEEHFDRIKRDHQCGLKANLEGTNDFESSGSKGWLKNSWDQNEDDSREVKLLSDQREISVIIYHPFPPKHCLTVRQLKYFDTLEPKIPLVKGKQGNRESYKLVKATPSNYIRRYAENKTDGCSCSTDTDKLGCACCIFWPHIDIVICAGCGYDPEEQKIVAEITGEDQLLYKWVKNTTPNALTELLKNFTKPLCYEKVWKIFKVNICVRMLGFLDLSFTKEKRSKLSLCPRVTTYILFWDTTVYEPDCWDLEFDIDIPGFGQRRIAGRANGFEKPKLTYEKNKLHLTNPVKTMFIIDNLEEIEKLIYELWEAERNGTILLMGNGSTTGKKKQNYGEDPKILKTGKPTDPVNWEPTDISKLHYLVVLYTQPLPSPLTTDDEDVKGLPGFESMIQQGLGRRTGDPSQLNLKVIASIGKSCGGVALTAGKILTLCTCVRYFYMYHKYNKNLKGAEMDPFTMISPDIYVTFADRRFTADQMVYQLDQNVNNFAKLSKCFEAIEDKKGVYDTHMHLVVMSITPELKNVETLQLVPFLENVSEKKTTTTPAEMTIIGMKKSKSGDLFDAAGNELDPLYEVVKVPFNSCPETQFCKKFLSPVNSKGVAPTEFRENTMCFCAKDKNFQLCDGVIGFPVITSEGLIGLNTLPMHCKDEGSMITALLSAGVINEINSNVGDNGPNADPDDPNDHGGNPYHPSKHHTHPPNPEDRNPEHHASESTLNTVSSMMTIISLSAVVPQ